MLALRVFLLRIRLLAIRSLLRLVIAFRSFIRRHSVRPAAGLAPAGIRLDSRTWAPVGHRKGRLLVLIVGTACAATLFMAGRQYEGGSLPSSPAGEVASKNSVETGDQADLALKGENANAATEAQAHPAGPDVVVLNPGTADQKERAPHQSRPRVHTGPATRSADVDIHKKGGDDRPSTSSRPMRGYQELRDYMLKR
jgi:hypothetical protein